MALTSALRNRAFRFLWTGQTVSRLGDGIYDITLAWWVLQRTHSATAMGGVLIAAFAPTLVLLLVGGVVADRLPRLSIMLVSDVLRGVLVLGIALLALMGVVPLGIIVGISFIFGLLDAFFLPAYSAVIPQVVTKDELPSANALRILSGRAMAILGPAAGAGLIAVGGTSIAFALNGASFFVSALCLVGASGHAAWAVPTARATAARPSVRDLAAHFRRDLAEGLGAVRALTWVWLTILIAAFVNLIAEGATSVALPYYVQHTFTTPLLLGGLTAATAAGSISGAAWFGGRVVRHRGHVIYAFLAANVLVLSVIALAPLPGVIFAGMFVYGLCATTLGLAWTTALQEYIPNEQMGRVSSVDQVGSYIGVPLSLGLGGLLTDHLGPLALLLWGGLAATAATLAGWLHPSVRGLD